MVQECTSSPYIAYFILLASHHIGIEIKNFKKFKMWI